MKSVSPWRRLGQWIGGAILLALLALNAVAYVQSRAMIHFSEGGHRTARPEALSLGEKLRVLALGVSLPRPINRLNPSNVQLAYETTEFSSRDGTRLEAWRLPATGPGPLLVLFHGYAGSKSDLLPVAAEFHRMGAEVWLVDFRGSGGSQGSMTSIGFIEAEDVAAAVQQAERQNREGRPLVLFGNSMGAAAVLRAVSLGTVQPAGLILECPFDRLLSTAANRFRAMGLPAFPAAPTLTFWGGVQLGFNGFAHNPVDYARSVACPTLLLQGGRDTRVTREQAESIASNLGAHGRLFVFPNLGHQSYLAAEPGVWRSEIVKFLNSIPSLKRG
jgi:alpha-beta hydrolase superfamily lysophospholipase